MKLELGHLEEDFSSVQNCAAGVRQGVGQNEKRGVGQSGRSGPAATGQICWWEAGWFKDWERVAKGS